MVFLTIKLKNLLSRSINQRKGSNRLRQLKERDVLSPKVLFFIDWLLSGSSETIIPENLRNKIAHGVDDMENFKTIYTKYNALSIILIYLSLSKS